VGDFVVRNLPEAVIRAIKRDARTRKQSFEARVREILTQAVGADRTEFIAFSRDFRKRLEGTWDLDSTAMIREDRDSR
jgi:plasmid stability protein